MGLNWLTADRIFDGADLCTGLAVGVRDGKVTELVPRASLGSDAGLTDLGAGILAPGFVDLQVNGGGGVMFNTAPELDTLQVMRRAHASIGACSILPTLITDRPAVTDKAIAAVTRAFAEGVPGIRGLHLEGPHLARARKGAHDGALIRPMTEEDLDRLCAAALALPCLIVTLAPETVTPDQIARLSRAGVIVSLGHSDADYDTCCAAIEAGARMVTHLFNAQSQLSAREPGLVGAALRDPRVSAGLIADGIHVHPATMTLALSAKQGPGQIFLVSDAMATAGSDCQSFELNGRVIRRSGDRLSLGDGTLAGAHLDLATAVRTLTENCGVPLPEALAMATRGPADLIGAGDIGRIAAGGRADLILLSDGLDLLGVWQAGVAISGPNSGPTR